MVRSRVVNNVRETVAGFGAISTDLLWQNLEFPETLQFMNTNIITNVECSIRSRVFDNIELRMNTPTIKSGHICTLGLKRVCFGDSGSPLITSDGVVGVVATGVLICSRYSANAPDVFVRVNTYLQWIDSYITNLS